MKNERTQTTMARPEWHIAIDERAALLHVRIAGLFELEDWFLVLDAVATTAGARPGMNVIYDAREAHFSFSTSDIDRLVAELPTHLEPRGRGCWSGFVVGTDVDFGISRMIHTLASRLPYQAEVFRSVAEAESWMFRARALAGCAA